MIIIFFSTSLALLYGSEAQAQNYIKNVEPSPLGNQIKSPAQIGLYNEDRLDMQAGVFAAQERSTDSQGQKVDVRGSKILLNSSFKTTPSFYWAAKVLKYDRYTESVLGEFEGSSSLRQWEYQLSAAFKILDAIILGTEYGLHDRKRGSDSLSEYKTKATKSALALLYKSNTWELGLAVKKITVSDDNYLEYALHTRALTSDSAAVSAYALKFPQESCCNLSSATRYEIGVGYQAVTQSNNFEITLAHRPNYEEGVEAEIAQYILSGLMEFGAQNASRWGMKSEYAFGEGKLRNRQVKYEKITGYLTYTQPL